MPTALRSTFYLLAYVWLWSVAPPTFAAESRIVTTDVGRYAIHKIAQKSLPWIFVLACLSQDTAIDHASTSLSSLTSLAARIKIRKRRALFTPE